MRKSIIVICLFLLTGATWEKQGASDEEFTQVHNLCQNVILNNYPKPTGNLDKYFEECMISRGWQRKNVNISEIENLVKQVH